ncbi:hypothetical protein Droror1_Dr00013836 [Drosera rotundifolia]
MSFFFGVFLLQGVNITYQQWILTEPFNSSWTMDSLRQRTPHRLMRRPTSGALSPPMNVQEMWRRLLIREFDLGKPNPFESNEVRSPPRPVSSNAFFQSQLSPPQLQPVAPFVSQFSAPSWSVSRVPYSGYIIILVSLARCSARSMQCTGLGEVCNCFLAPGSLTAMVNSRADRTVVCLCSKSKTRVGEHVHPRYDFPSYLPHYHRLLHVVIGSF